MNHPDEVVERLHLDGHDPCPTGRRHDGAEQHGTGLATAAVAAAVAGDGQRGAGVRALLGPYLKNSNKTKILSNAQRFVTSSNFGCLALLTFLGHHILFFLAIRYF